MHSSSEPTAPAALGIEEIRAAAARIAQEAVRTPLIESRDLNDRSGGRILIKPEVLQRTGSFKFRGAYNKISQIPLSRRPAGVLAYSSGNHAQGVAQAAALCQTPATIVMPRSAPQIKIINTRGFGARVVLYDPATDNRETIAQKLLEESDMTFVRPYDDPDIIAGQGTCGLEIVAQVEDLGVKLDALLVCCGGGGLCAGVGTVFKTLSPDTEVYSVEPEGFDDTARSLNRGERVTIQSDAQSICDALLTPTPGELTFPINARNLSGGLAVSDREVMAAMAYAARTLKLVVEPGGAVSLAAILSRRFDASGKTVAITLSGGNVDPAMLTRAMEEAA